MTTTVLGGQLVKCDCCGMKTMAVEYGDRIVIKVHGHVVTIPKQTDLYSVDKATEVIPR
jgi:predicted HNH restriction endonuclease